MTTVPLECGHCGRETTHDLERVLRGLTLADVMPYLADKGKAPELPRKTCHRCGYNRLVVSLDSMGWCKDTQSCESLYQWHRRQKEARV